MAQTADPSSKPILPPSPSSSTTPTGNTIHSPPPPFTSSTLQPLTQGAEALVYRTTFLSPHTPAVLKYRPPKPYRHPVLDKRLTKARLLAEARVLVKCKREGVGVPGVMGADWEGGWLVLEWVEGGTVRGVLDGWVEREVEAKKGEEGGEEDCGKEEREREMLGLVGRVGRAVGRLHEAGVCHGDLTTSNLMVRDDSGEERREEEEGIKPRGKQTASSMREAAMTDADSAPAPPSPPSIYPSLTGPIILIDFGLATQTVQDEDRAVDLYVLERAFAATHPAAEPLFKEVLRAYGESFKGAGRVLRRLEEVRGRGRKRSMVG